MTVASGDSSIEYSGNSSLTVFAVTFTLQDSVDLVVTLVDGTGTETVQTLDTDYTVGVASVTFTTAPATGYTVRIERTIALTQSVDLSSQGQFSPGVYERALDRLTLITQQLQRRTEDLEDSTAFTDFLVAIQNIAGLNALLTGVAATNVTNTWSAAQMFSALATFSTQSLHSQGLKTAKTNPYEAHWTSDTRPPGSQLRFQVAGWYIHSGANVKARLFAAESGSGGQFELSINADWNGTHWVADQADGAALHRWDGRETNTYRKSTVTAGMTWLPSAWDVDVANIRTTITPNAGWTAGAADSAPRHWKDSSGMVHLSGTLTRSGGTVTAGSVPTIVAAGGLPTASRPNAERRAPVCTNFDEGVCQLYIYANGSLAFSALAATAYPNGTVVYLDGVSFRAEQ